MKNKDRYFLVQNRSDKEMIELWHEHNERKYLACVFHVDCLPRSIISLDFPNDFEKIEIEIKPKDEETEHLFYYKFDNQDEKLKGITSEIYEKELEENKEEYPIKTEIHEFDERPGLITTYIKSNDNQLIVELQKTLLKVQNKR